MSGLIGTTNSRSKIIGRSFDTAIAWVKFNGVGTLSVINSYNISSVGDEAQGKYKVNFTGSAPNANYSVATDGVEDNGLYSSYGAGSTCHAYHSSATTTYFYMSTAENGGTWQDLRNINAIVFGK